MLARLEALGFQPRGGLSTSELLIIARNWGRPLPIDYATFLMETGGGWFTAPVVVESEGLTPYSPDGLTTLDELFGRENGSLERALTSTDYNDVRELSIRLMAIGENLVGDVVCLNRTGQPAVLYWEHNTGDLFPLGRSFAEFIERVRLDPSEPGV